MTFDLASYFIGMVAVLAIEAVIPSPGPEWSAGAAIFITVMILLGLAIS